MATQVVFLTLQVRLSSTVVGVNEDISREYRYDENLRNLRWGGCMLPIVNTLSPWKGNTSDLYNLYPEPAQVPLGEKPKVWWDNPFEGIRQISPVPSVQGVPATVFVWMLLQGAITRAVRLFNKNLAFCKPEKASIEGDICPVLVLQTPVQRS